MSLHLIMPFLPYKNYIKHAVNLNKTLKSDVVLRYNDGSNFKQ